jgi:ADP-ribose pyrophosphatase
VRNGQITDVKTVIGMFWLEKIVNGSWTPPQRPAGI